jgi:hypothetical protein
MLLAGILPFGSYPFMAQPGELMSGSDRDAHFPNIAELRKVYQEVGWAQRGIRGVALADLPDASRLF